MKDSPKKLGSHLEELLSFLEGPDSKPHLVSDLAAEVTGGLGMAPSANIHPGRNALFEPVHGSAPDIAGTGRANPVGAIRCVGLLLDHFGHREAAARVDDAVVASLRQAVTTPDLGGDRSTEEVGAWIADRAASPRASGA